MKEDQVRVLIAVSHHQIYDNHSPRTVWKWSSLETRRLSEETPVKRNRVLKSLAAGMKVYREDKCAFQPSFSPTNAGPSPSPNFCLPALLNPHTLWPPCLLKVSFLEQLLNDSPEHTCSHHCLKNSPGTSGRLLLQEAFPDLPRSRRVMFP